MSLPSQILLLVVLIAFSAFFSGTEAAFMSCNHIRLKNLSDNGSQKASKVLYFLDRFEEVLSTLLIGNNLVNIMATAVATAMFTKLFPEQGVTVSTIVMTVSVLIFGEISPKTAANHHPEKTAMRYVSAFEVIYYVLKPLCWLFKPVSFLANKLSGPDKSGEGAAEEELITMIDEAEEGGNLEKDESQLIRSAIEFNDADVDEVLTPRVNMTAIEDTTPMNEVRDIFFKKGFSRIPVYHGTIDNIIGILHEKDFMAHYIRGGHEYLSLLTKVFYVPTSMKISDLLKKFQQNKTHMALVLDESGGIEGLVTMEDILEELVGEIYDEHDEVEINIQKLTNGRYKMRGSAELDDVFETLGIDRDPDDFESTTLGGFLMEEMERIPAKGDHFEFANVDFLVTQAGPKGVKEVVAEKLPEKAPEEVENEKNEEE